MSRTVRYSLNKNKYLLPHEVARLRQILDDFYHKDHRNTLILELALATGARALELLNLSPVDMNSSDQTIFIRGVKGSNDREIPLRPALYEKLARFSAEQAKAATWTLAKRPNTAAVGPGQSERLFGISYERLYQVWLLYRPVPKKLHALRHTFAIELYQKTKDIRLLQVALGHRSITNTMIYADYLYSKDELRRLILPGP